MIILVTVLPLLISFLGCLFWSNAVHTNDEGHRAYVARITRLILNICAIEQATSDTILNTYWSSFSRCFSFIFSTSLHRYTSLDCVA